MKNLTLEHIEQALSQNPHPSIKGDVYADATALTKLVKAISPKYPEVSLFSCVVLGFGLDTLDKSKKTAPQNVINSLETEDAECSHASEGIGIGGRYLCQFGIVNEEEWGKACKKHLIELIAKQNLRCSYMDKPQFDELALICNPDPVSDKWHQQVLASIEASLIAAETPEVPRTSPGHRL